MRHLLLLSALALGFLAIPAQATVVTVCASGCTTTSLQTALDSTAACDDTISIKSTEEQTGTFTIAYRGCSAEEPITVTSDRCLAGWNPTDGQRVSPSALANLAVLVAPGGNTPALKDVLDGMNRPPAHWRFKCIAFRASTGGTYFPIHFNSYDATGSSQLADDITLDSIYIYSPLPNTPTKFIQGAIRADATNLIVKNSFIADAWQNGFNEAYGVDVLTNPGPVTVTNNFIMASAEPIFAGGVPPTYPAYLENGLTARYNYTWKPWKWNMDPAQPNAADYIANASPTSRLSGTITGITNDGVLTSSVTGSLIKGSLLTITGVSGCPEANGSLMTVVLNSGQYKQLRNFTCSTAYVSGGTFEDYGISPCLKNHGELKWATNAIWEYNVGEYMPEQAECPPGGQRNGYTGTLRTNWDYLGTVATFSSTTVLTWSGTYRIAGAGACCTQVGDLSACATITSVVYCRPIASYNGTPSLTVSPAFPSAPGGSTNPLWVVYTGSASLAGLTVQNNVFKNVSTCVTNLAMSYGNIGVGNAGKSTGSVFDNNLCLANDGYTTLTNTNRGMLFVAAESPYDATSGAMSWTHNTALNYLGFAGPFAYFAGYANYNGIAFNNNLFGPTSTGGNGPFSGDGASTICEAANLYMTSSNIKNNGIPGGTAGSGCTGATQSGNVLSAWSDPYGGTCQTLGICKPMPGSNYSGLATDGTDIGVAFDKLPLITSVAIKAQATHALLTANLAGPIAAAGTTQPCTLEVSTDSDLRSALNSYSVINALNPAYFKQADSSAHTNPLIPNPVVSNGHLSMPIGINSTVTDDNGDMRNLALTASTLYYYRLMCYGDTVRGTFTTAASDSAAASLSVNVSAVTGADSAIFYYGTEPNPEGEVVGTVSGGRVTATIPTAGDYTYWLYRISNSMAQVIYTSPNRVYVPQ